MAALFFFQDHMTALMLAACDGNAEFAEVLVKAGADKNAKNVVST